MNESTGQRLAAAEDIKRAAAQLQARYDDAAWADRRDVLAAALAEAARPGQELRARMADVVEQTEAVVAQLVDTGDYWRGHIDGMRHVAHRLRDALGLR